MGMLQAIPEYSTAQIATIRRTVAADCNDNEFNLFMAAARSYGLDPHRRQISAIVFSKDKADKRRMAIIVGRDGLRAIAQRCGDYRPATGPAHFEIDPSLKGPTNPLGIVMCGVTVYKQDAQGEWHPVYGEAYWDEFAPIKDEWAYDQQEGRRKPTGKQTVDGQWAKMPRLMIQKCAEAQALRAGWPEVMAGLYEAEEMDQARARYEHDGDMKDITPADAARQHETEERQARIGGPAITFTFDDVGTLDRVPLGQVADRCLAFIRDGDPETVHRWAIRNREALKEFWAHSPGDALEIKQKIEAADKEFLASARTGDAA